MTDIKTKPPANTQRIMRVADLPQDRASASYELRNGDDKPYIVHLSKRQRQVMELLMAGPVYCASPVRLTPLEGASVMALVEAYRKTLETTELESRIAALEAAK